MIVDNFFVAAKFSAILMTGASSYATMGYIIS
jgi:hypothetical protein